MKFPGPDSKEEGGESSALTALALGSPGCTYYMGHNTNEERLELQRIELAARTCYKSEDKMTGDSSVKMFEMLERRGHLAMLRFGERTVKMQRGDWCNLERILTNTHQIQYWRWAWAPAAPETVFVTANLCSWLNLALIVNKGAFSNALRCFCINAFEGWPHVQKVVRERVGEYYMHEDYNPIYVKDVSVFDLVELRDDHGYNLFRYCFRVVCDRGISHEIVRHTTLSYAQESTRWINYGGKKDRGLADLVFKPEHLEGHPAWNIFTDEGNFLQAMAEAYKAYQHWTNEDNPCRLVPGDARNFFPHCLKTELCISGYIDKSPIGKEFNQGFSHFIDMRAAKDAHKGVQVIARAMAEALGYPLPDNAEEK
ncbi:MAG: FAD-dependent thymidylate synthase [Muribaculaceae bacterium]|nr:FAD-dependent thymidylate synthase [Muribaculaceae bacterium]